ncbi:MAG: type II toxin-antitoxin system antitoxin SocA domain-containing protein [Pyrinomonadaceae bacterium]
MTRKFSVDSIEVKVPDLAADEIATIDWVLDNYGTLSSSEISDQSHREKAYRFTRPGEKIAYRYAAFFENLPSR